MHDAIETTVSTTKKKYRLLYWFLVPPEKLPEVITDDVTEDAADRAMPSDRATP